MNRRSYYPSNQQIVSQMTAASTAVDASRPVTPKADSPVVHSSGGAITSAIVPEGVGETERYAPRPSTVGPVSEKEYHA